MSVAPKVHLQRVSRTSHPAQSRQAYELMDRNERTVDFPPDVMRELRELISPFLLRAYPEPAPLYQRLSAWLGVPREQLLLTWGADGALKTIYDAYAGSGDEVVSARPSYAMYPVYASMVGAVAREVSFRSDLSFPLDDLLRAITSKTKLVVLANPNQPIERVYEDRELRALLDLCAKTHTLLVMDEAYAHFSRSSAWPCLPVSDHLIIVRTFSKAFGLAGLRLGYCVAAPTTIAALQTLRPMYEASAVAIAMGCYMLDHPELMTSYVAEVRQTMDWLREQFTRMGFQTFGRWGNSLLVALPGRLSSRQVKDAMQRRGFLVRAETEPPLSNHLRITVGPKAQAERFWTAFTSVLGAHEVEQREHNTMGLRP